MNYKKTLPVWFLATLLFAACAPIQDVPREPEISPQEQLIQNTKARAEQEWENAKQENTLSAYKEFLDYLGTRSDFPGKDELKNKAENRVQKLEEIAEKEIKREQELKRRKEEEEKAWEEAQHADSREAYAKFLLEFPSGVYHIQAEKAKEKIKELEEARRLDPLMNTMIFVEGGSFIRGCTSAHEPYCYNNEKPAHAVYVSDFYIGKFPVTQKQWERVMGNNPSDRQNCPNCPVTNVSWNDAKAFINQLNARSEKNYRLPTEAEWEFAARGGSKSRGDFLYAGSNNINDVSYYRDNANSRTHPVGSKAPNELGIHDMSGNVGEWCYDFYANYTIDGGVNLSGPKSGHLRVYRGGSWRASASYCRVSSRAYGPPNRTDSSIGFRVARSAE